MRETFKSLSIFSAMLMLLLMISTGCDVNIPGCGKRSLPFFKQMTPVTVNANVASSLNTTAAPAVTNSISNSPSPVAIATKPTVKVSSTSAIPLPTPIPVDIEKIAYTTMEEKQPTLWTMNTDGTERTRLTAIGTSSWTPLWSPNGKTLAFLSTANDGKVNLYMVPKGSTQLVQLTSWEDMKRPDSTRHQPLFTWSPKSDQIVYGYKNQVWLLQLDTLEQSTLVTVDPSYTIEAVAWAPHRENKYVAYTVRKGANYYSVMLVNPRLKDKLTLIDSIKSVPSISWSSGAEKLAYVSGNKALYTTTVEESTPKVVINSASPDLAPFVAFSPVEGAAKLLLLAKESSNDTGYKVAIVDQAAKTDQDTGTLKYLTPAGVESATWSPDSTKIAYVISGELWIMESSGMGKMRIALTGIQSPDWSKK
ncbi:MAG TPA: hypothetical protein VK791_03125 [bacterium]|nr:hypothetical protein [bacterium]